MTTVAVLADPPVEGAVLPELVASTPLSESDACQLYEAMLVDICTATQAGGGDLLVNYRESEAVAGAPDDFETEAALRDVLDDALDAPGEARYEVQVGETFAGRVGNTTTHLLEEEDERSVAAIKPTTPFLGREQIGSAAMKIRSSDVVLGPTTDGRVHYAAFAEPINFENAYERPAVETLTERARDAGLDVDFMPMLPVVETERDLVDVVARVRSLLRAERNVPIETARVIDELGLYVDADGDGLTVGRTSDRS